MDQPAAAADAPGVAEACPARVFTHRLPTENESLECAERRVFGKLDVESAIETAALVKDSLLGQPIKPTPRARDEPRQHACILAGRAIDPLAGLRREREARAGSGFGGPADVVAAAETARGVDQHRLQRSVVGVGQPDLGRALLVEDLQPRAPVEQLCCDPAFTAGALKAGG